MKIRFMACLLIGLATTQDVFAFCHQRFGSPIFGEGSGQTPRHLEHRPVEQSPLEESSLNKIISLANLHMLTAIHAGTSPGFEYGLLTIELFDLVHLNSQAQRDNVQTLAIAAELIEVLQSLRDGVLGMAHVTVVNQGAGEPIRIILGSSDVGFAIFTATADDPRLVETLMQAEIGVDWPEPFSSRQEFDTYLVQLCATKLNHMIGLINRNLTVFGSARAYSERQISTWQAEESNARLSEVIEQLEAALRIDSDDFP